jgi:2-dehydro-3-deoxyphosphogluconate aldolase/(4S)-4-hydroxy-2-oxoglutarate aldolase
MSKDAIFDAISAVKLLPVVVIENVADAVPLAKALVEGGLPVAEVTFRTAAAAEAISEIAKHVPEILLGAGTVLTPDQVDAAKRAGASFLVTPGFNPEVVQRAAEVGLPIVPGINNPSGVEQAMSAGLGVVKFFPAGPSGGPAFIKALSGPYGEMRFIPTGGVGAENIGDYLALPAVLACGGSWMVDPKLIAAGNFAEITRLTAEAVAAVKSAHSKT